LFYDVSHSLETFGNITKKNQPAIITAATARNQTQGGLISRYFEAISRVSAGIFQHIPAFHCALHYCASSLLHCAASLRFINALHHCALYSSRHLPKALIWGRSLQITSLQA
jgi:hypothetical protein